MSIELLDDEDNPPTFPIGRSAHYLSSFGFSIPFFLFIENFALPIQISYGIFAFSYFLLGLRQKIFFYPEHVKIKRTATTPCIIPYSDIRLVKLANKQLLIVKNNSTQARMPVTLESRNYLEKILQHFRDHGVTNITSDYP